MKNSEKPKTAVHPKEKGREEKDIRNPQSGASENGKTKPSQKKSGREDDIDDENDDLRDDYEVDEKDIRDTEESDEDEDQTEEEN